MSILKKLYPECEITQLKDTTLSSAWAAAMSKGAAAVSTGRLYRG